MRQESDQHARAVPPALLSSSTTQTLIYGRTYNAFGEVTSETDPRGYIPGNIAADYTTNYTYNTIGKVIKKESPPVDWTSETGAVTLNARPTENYFYDLSGRLIGTQDANGNFVKRTWLAGTGFAGSEGLVTAELYATGQATAAYASTKTLYDVFGDARIHRNELSQDETRTFDAMGRLITLVHRGGLLTDNYVYDVLGQRTRHWNSLLGSGNVEKTDYDLQGRVTSQVAFGGDTTTSYVWNAGIVTSGLSPTAIGGWVQTTTYANSKTLIETSDIFGHQTAKTDLGGHNFTYSYDRAGRQVTQAGTFSGGETLTSSYYNSGQLAFIGNGASYAASSNGSTYTYDASGNKLAEVTKKAGATVQNATAQYGIIL